MASNAQIGNSWRFMRGDGGSPEVFTLVPEVVEIIPGAATSPDLDVTHLQSTAREFRPGLPSFATFTINLNYVPADPTQNAMEDEAPSSTTRHYRVLDPTSSFGFQYDLAIATYVRAGFTVDGVIRSTATFKQSGKPTRVGAA